MVAFGEARVNAPILFSACAGAQSPGEPLSEKRRHTVTTIESREIWIIKRPEPERPKILCDACPRPSGMLTVQDAAEQAGVSQRTVFRWLDEGAIHFTETAGGLFVCLAPLTVDIE